jgi:cytochrome b6-f complex iron-sulfur subunit
MIMDRKDFISTLGFSVAAVCTGCLAACSKSGSAASSTGGGAPPASVNFSINLNNQLLNVGDQMVNGGVILARIAAGNNDSDFTAVQVACTHQGTSINYVVAQNQFVCPLHGSIFSTSGSVVQGPAASSLKKYNITITGSTLTVTG